MQMRPGASARISAEGDPLTLFHLLTHAHQNPAQMGIAGLSSSFMLNVYHVAVAAGPARSGDRTAAGRHDRRSHRRRPVRSLVIGGGPCRGCVPSSITGCENSSGNRLDECGRNPGSPADNPWYCLEIHLFQNDFLGNLLIVPVGFDRRHLPVAFRGFLHRLLLVGIPFVHVHVFHWRVIIFLLIDELSVNDGKLRLRNRDDQILACPDGGILILQRGIDGDQVLHGQGMLQRDLGKCISGLNLVDFLLRLFVHHLLHRFLQGRQLLLHQIGLCHFYGIRKFQFHQAVIQIFKALRGRRLCLGEHFLEKGAKAGPLRFIVSLKLLRPADYRGQHVQLSFRIHRQTGRVFVLRIIFIQTGV